MPKPAAPASRQACMPTGVMPPTGSSGVPAGTPLMPVGGITPTNMAEWRAAGASGFGIGSALYKPGKQASGVRADAERFVSACTGAIHA